MALEFRCGSAMDDAECRTRFSDCWLHTHGGFDSDLAKIIKTQLKAAFCADDPVWEGMVLGQSLSSCRQALTALSGQQ